MIDIELLIFAAVAVFVLARLYAVLGRKTGAEPPPAVLREADNKGFGENNTDEEEEDKPSLRPAFTGPGASGMEDIAAIDPKFNPRDFLQRAKKAYEMIVNSFAEGDRETLSNLLDEDVYDAYCSAIDARESEGREPLRLMRLKSGEIADACIVSADVAQVSVSFEAQLSDGENLRTAKEIWTFERALKSSDPAWRLTEVSEAS